MERISLFVFVLLFALVAFVGCHKESVDYGNVGVVNLSLQRGYKTANKGAVAVVLCSRLRKHRGCCSRNLAGT